jgi:hypothetical protein
VKPGIDARGWHFRPDVHPLSSTQSTASVEPQDALQADPVSAEAALNEAQHDVPVGQLLSSRHLRGA